MNYILLALWINYAPGMGTVAENTQIHTERFESIRACQEAKNLILKFDSKTKVYCLDNLGVEK